MRKRSYLAGFLDGILCMIPVSNRFRPENLEHAEACDCKGVCFRFTRDPEIMGVLPDKNKNPNT